MSETINAFNLLEVQARVSEADEQIIRADERAKVIDECMVAMNELAVKWFNQGCIALGDIPRLAEQLKEQGNE